MTMPGEGSATAHDATVVAVNGPVDVEARARQLLKASAAVDHTWRVVESCDKTIERAQAKLDKARADLDAAHRQLDRAIDDRDAAMAEHDSFVAAYNELKGTF